MTAAPPTEHKVSKVKAAMRPVFWFEAARDTWLKKAPDQASSLADNEVVRVPAGKRYGVISTRELHNDAHEFVELAGGAGRWFVFAPHFHRIQTVSEALPRTVDWSDFNCLVTPHITVGEVLNFDRRRRPEPGNSNISRILATCDEAEKVRAAAARSLGLTGLGFTSFYRPEPINRQVGGAPGSWHVQGMAIDVYPFGCSLQQLWDYVFPRWTGGLGDGRHKGFLHLDREGGGGFVPGGGRRPCRLWSY